MSARARLLLDLGMFGVMVAAFYPSWTGLVLHEWLSVVVIVPLLFHVVINWDQTLHVVERFAARMRALPRVNLVVDIALFVAAVAVMLSGLMVSQVVGGALGVTIAPSAAWVALHSASADAVITLLLVHLALHWRWILNVARRIGAPNSRPAVAARPVTSPPVGTSVIPRPLEER